MDSSEDGECTSNIDDANLNACPIRKRRFSNARIQPTRIKKVMQSDEDIGRMVASVPVAIGSAMEHFAEKLLEAASACVPNTTSRTLSPMHIKYAIMMNPQFAFLEPLVRDIKLPKCTDGVLMSGLSSASVESPALHSFTPSSSRYGRFSTLSNNNIPSTSSSSSSVVIDGLSALTPALSAADPTTSASTTSFRGFASPSSAHIPHQTTSAIGNQFVFSNLWLQSQHPPPHHSLPQPAYIAHSGEPSKAGEKKRKRGRPPRVDRPNVGSDFPSLTGPATADIVFTAQPPAARQNGADAPPLAKCVAHVGVPDCALAKAGLPTIFEHDPAKVATEPLEQQ